VISGWAIVRQPFAACAVICLMDVRSPTAEETKTAKPGNGVPGRPQFPLTLEDPQPPSAMPRALRGAAQAATVGIFIILFLVGLSLAKPIVLPTTAAFVITMMLSPLSERADRYRVPAWLTATVLWLAVVAAAFGVIDLVSAPVIDWVHKAPDIGRSIQDKLQVLAQPLSGLRDLRDALLPSQSDKGVNVDVVAIVQQTVSFATPALGQALILFVALFFMLLGRRRLRHVVVRYFSQHEARLRALRIMNDIERNLTGYLSVVAVINAGVGVGAGIIAALVGLPNPVAWGVLGFVLNFIPYMGAGIMELGMFLVGIVTFPSLTHALVAPLLYIAMGLIEGQFLTPGILGRHFTLNPLTVFLSLVFWAWLWGPVGAFLAVPLLIIGMVAVAHLFPRAAPDLPD
jgi:predicted PurR-regulated permease PerM